MQNKTKILIFGGIGLVAIVVILFLVLHKTAPTAPGNVTQNNGSTSSGSGGVNNPPAGSGNNNNGGGQQNSNNTPSTIVHLKPGALSYTDSAQPFTASVPRQGPVKTATVNNPTVVNALPDPTDITNPDYQLSQDAFLAKYYPNASQVINGSTAQDLALNAEDPVLVDNSPAGTVSVNIPNNTNVSDSIFKIGTSSDLQSDLNFIQALSDATASFDLVHNPDLLTGVLSTLDPSQIPGLEQQTQNAINNMLSLTVPQNMLGLEKDYYDFYQQYNSFLGDVNSTLTLRDKSQLDAKTTLLQNDVTNLTGALNNINQDIEAAQQAFGSFQPNAQ